MMAWGKRVEDGEGGGKGYSGVGVAAATAGGGGVEWWRLPGPWAGAGMRVMGGREEERAQGKRDSFSTALGRE